MKIFPTDNSLVSDPNSLYLRTKIFTFYFILFLKYNELGSDKM